MIRSPSNVFTRDEESPNELEEDPEIRDAFNQLSKLVSSLDNFKPNPDPQYLMRFLRVKKYNVSKAFNCYKKFQEVRLLRPDQYYPRGTGPRDVMRIFDLKSCAILPKINPIDNTFVSITRVGDWTTSCGVSLEEAVTPVLLVGEVILSQVHNQLHGGHLVFDISRMKIQMLSQFTFNATRALLGLANGGYPCKLKGFHIIHNNSAFSLLYRTIRPLLRKKVVERVHFHGSDLQSLHKYIDPSILPDEYGGTAGEFPWKMLREEMWNRHEELVESSMYGFQVGGVEKLEKPEVGFEPLEESTIIKAQ